jgi:hypothetical protein
MSAGVQAIRQAGFLVDVLRQFLTTASAFVQSAIERALVSCSATTIAVAQVAMQISAATPAPAADAAMIAAPTSLMPTLFECRPQIRQDEPNPHRTDADERQR